MSDIGVSLDGFAFYLLEGELTFQLDGEVFTRRAGELAFAPHRVAHTNANLSGARARAFGDHACRLRALRIPDRSGVAEPHRDRRDPRRRAWRRRGTPTAAAVARGVRVDRAAADVAVWDMTTKPGL